MRYLFILFLILSCFSIQAQWLPVGSGFTGGDMSNNNPGERPTDVQGMVVYNNELYVWGDFDFVDGNQANNFAKYDGTSWSALPFTGFARDMEVFQGELYIAGYTGTSGPLPNRHITKWDGTNWMALDSNYILVNDHLKDGPFDLKSYKGHLYLGGRNFNIGSPSVGGMFNHSGIARWNGSTWDSLPIGSFFAGYLIHFSEYMDSLIITSTNGIWLDTLIADWFFFDGQTWSSVFPQWQPSFSVNQYGNAVQLGSKLFRSPRYISTPDTENTLLFSSNWPSDDILKFNDLIVSIKFDTLIQVTDSFLNFNYLNPFSTIDLNFYESMTIYKDTLYVGGNYTEIDASVMNGIMKWGGKIDSTTLTINQNFEIENRINVYPNPTTTNFIVKGEIPKGSVLELFTIQGEKVQSWSTSRNTNSIQIELSDSPPGIYVVKIHSPERSWESRIVKQ